MLARFLTNVKVRAGPSTSSESVATYKSGETVKYDKTVNNEGRLLISYIGNSGNRRYCCAIDTNGEKYIDLGNNSSNNNNNSGGNAQTVLASYFSDKTGCKDNDLYDGGLYYAELSLDPAKKDFRALGGLPFGQKLKITYKGKSVIATKGDVGAGGPHHPKIDIHENLAKALGFEYGLDYVEIEKI